MKRQQSMLTPNASVTALAYELNAVALSFAGEIERITQDGDAASVTFPLCGPDIVPQLELVIRQLHEATLALRYFRHNGEMPPPRSAMA